MQVSVGSEALFSTVSADDSSNDGLVIVDDSAAFPQPPSAPPPPQPGPPAKRGRGRPRGRPPGSGVARTSAAMSRSVLSGRGVSRRPRGRGSTQKAVAAAELAAAQAGKSAGYAAYGYSYKKGEFVSQLPFSSWILALGGEEFTLLGSVVRRQHDVVFGPKDNVKF